MEKEHVAHVPRNEKGRGRMALNSVQRSELNSEFVRGTVLELEFQPGGQSMTTECPHSDAIRTCKNTGTQVSRSGGC